MVLAPSHIFQIRAPVSLIGSAVPLLLSKRRRLRSGKVCTSTSTRRTKTSTVNAGADVEDGSGNAASRRPSTRLQWHQPARRKSRPLCSLDYREHYRRNVGDLL